LHSDILTDRLLSRTSLPSEALLLLLTVSGCGLGCSGETIVLLLAQAYKSTVEVETEFARRRFSQGFGW
jgi:hypothetical protein